MDKKRASLSAAMLEAMVFVAHNAAMFDFTIDELYDKYVYYSIRPVLDRVPDRRARAER